MARTDFWQRVLHPTDIIQYPSRVEGFQVPGGELSNRPSSVPSGTLRRNDTDGGIDIYLSGDWYPISTSLVSGEINDGENVGGGYGLYYGKSGVNIQFKSLVPGENVKITPVGNTLVFEAEITNPDVFENIGTGTGEVYAGNSGGLNMIRTLSSNSPELDISTVGDNIEFTLTLPSFGETNTASNVGSGAGVFKIKDAYDLRFRSLISGTTNVLTLAQNNNDITFDVSENPSFGGTSHIGIPTGTTAERPGSPFIGYFRMNTDLGSLEVYHNSDWNQLYDTSDPILLTTGGTITGDYTFTGGAGVTVTGGGDININGGNIIMSSGGTVDGRDVSRDGEVIDAMVRLTEPPTLIGPKPIEFFFPLEGETSPSYPLNHTRGSTGSYFDRRGLLADATSDVVRLDYDPNNHSLNGWLIEGTRTNLQIASSRFDNWTANNSTVNFQSTESLTGSTTASDQVPDNSANLGTDPTETGLQGPTSSKTAGNTYTFSIYAKEKGFDSIQLEVVDTTNNKIATFNMSTETASLVSGSSASAYIHNIRDGWYRCAITWEQTTTENEEIRISAIDSSVSVGDGTNGVIIFAAQLEENPYPTSYIDTGLVTSETSSLDVLSTTITDTDIPTDGGGLTICGERIMPNGISNTSQTLVSFNDGSFDNHITISRDSTTTNTIRLEVVNATVQQCDIYSTPIVGTARMRYSAVVEDDMFSLTIAVDGVDLGNGIGRAYTYTDDLSGAFPTGVTNINFGNSWDGNSPLNGHVVNDWFYPISLSQHDRETMITFW